MDERRKLEVIRNIVLNGDYKPSEFLEVVHCITYLDERLAEMPLPEPKEPKSVKRRKREQVGN
jgi:hypothetical protein